MIRIGVFAALIVSAVLGSSQNHYVCAPQTCPGKTVQDGSDWSKSWDKLPARLERGHTYYVAKGTYAGHTFDDEADGTTPITIKAVTTADHGANHGWSDAYVGTAHFNTASRGRGIFVFLQPYYIIDGQYRADDWMSGYGFHIDNSVRATKDAAVLLEAHDITVRYTDVEGSHDNSTGVCGPPPAPGGHLYCDEAFQDFGQGNILIEYSYIHDQGEVTFKLRGSSTSEGSGPLDRFTAQYNLIARNWSEGGTEGVHGEAFSVSDGVQNLVIRYNKFQDIRGTAVIASASGSSYKGVQIAPGLWHYNRGNGPWFIYGNLWWYTSPPIPTCAVGGFVALWDVGFRESVHIYNNTIANINDDACPIGTGGNASINGQGLETAHFSRNAVYVRNNLWVNSDGGVYLDLADGKVVDNHNKIEHGGSLFKNLPAHDYRLIRHTSGGTSLSNIGSQSFDVDMDGHPRRNWDIGAFESLRLEPGPPRVNVDSRHLLGSDSKQSDGSERYECDHQRGRTDR